MTSLLNQNKKSMKSLVNESFNPVEQKINNLLNLSQISVLHRTETKNLSNIMSEGLRIEKSVTPIGATEIIEISKRIKKELGKPEDRYKSIYATFNDAQLSCSDLNDLYARNESMIEFKVNINDNQIFVADFESINKAIFNQIDYNRKKNHQFLLELEKNLYEYWNSFILLDTYIKENKKYNFPEILIFHDIEPNKINIIKKCNSYM